MKTLLYPFFFTFIFVSTFCSGQSINITPDMQENVKMYNTKIDELITNASKNGFHLVREEKLPLRNNIDLIVNINLQAGNLYHFCFVGDPGSTKVKATLFLEGYGDLVQDRIKVRRENEFWTEFSFLCPLTGRYELTLLQKSPISRPLSYLTVFKKEKQLEDISSSQ